jgi:hypothetical protein
MQEFKDVVKSRTIPITFQLKCTLCGHQVSEFDFHFALIDMNEHIKVKHGDEVKALDMEELYSRKPDITLDTF